MDEREQHDQGADERDDESPEEFARDIESDPAHNPDDPDLDRVRGG